jgi:P4 family phage/plasmid primase-like protien
VFDTISLEFRDGKPDDYISFSTKVDYDPSKPYYEHESWPEIDRFVKSVLPDKEVREYFMLHLATSLSGNNSQRFHIMTGSGSNGKSMLMNLMTTVMGDYCCKVPITLLTQQRGKSSAASPEMVRIKGRRFATMQEPDEKVPLNTGLMKELTSTEKVTARDLFAGAKAMIDFYVQARFHLACNDKPTINAKDGGTWRRLIVINFLSKFVHNPSGPGEFMIDESLMQKTMSQEWATAFLSYLVHLYKTHNGIRKLDIPRKVQEYSEEYKEENDLVSQYIRENIVTFNNADVTIQPDPISKGQLTNSFQEWKRSNEYGKGGQGSSGDLVKKIESIYGKYPKNGWTAFQFVNA